MADYNLKSITPDTTPADANMVFGADDQSSATPVPYTFAGIKTWIKSWSGVTHPGYVSGNWYVLPNHRPVAGVAVGANSMKFVPFMVTQPVTVAQMSARVTAIQASQNFQLALYGASASTRKPTGTALSSTSSLSTAVTGNIAGALGASVALAPWTLYYAAINCDHATPAFQAANPQYGMCAEIVGSTNVDEVVVNSTSMLSGFSVAQTFNTWPDVTASSFAALGGTANTPLFLIKAA